MIKYKKLRISVYNADVWVVSAPEDATKLAWKILHMVVEDDHFDNCNGMCLFGTPGDIIWLPPGASVGTIAHECTHAALNIFHRKGVRVDLSNQEPTTYLIGHLVDIVTDAHQALTR